MNEMRMDYEVIQGFALKSCLLNLPVAESLLSKSMG